MDLIKYKQQNLIRPVSLFARLNLYLRKKNKINKKVLSGKATNLDPGSLHPL